VCLCVVCLWCGSVCGVGQGVVCVCRWCVSMNGMCICVWCGGLCVMCECDVCVCVWCVVVCVYGVCLCVVCLWYGVCVWCVSVCGMGSVCDVRVCVWYVCLYMECVSVCDVGVCVWCRDLCMVCGFFLIATGRVIIVLCAFGVYFNFRESSDLRSSQVTHSWWLRESLAGRPGHLDPRWDHFHFSLECSPGLGEGLAGCVALQLLLCPLMIPFLNFTDVDLQ